MSHCIMVKVYGALVDDTGIKGTTVDACVPGEVHMTWKYDLEHVVTPNFVTRPKIIGIYQNTSYSYPQGALGDNEQFLNEATDTVVAGAGTTLVF